jgi:UDP-N-acetylmuramoylalanine--D-glutamate ligase
MSGSLDLSIPGVVASEVARRIAMHDGEVAVLGLGRSGTAVSRLLRAAGMAVYASDKGDDATIRTNAAALAKLGATTQIGGHDLQRIARAGFVVASPGIPPHAPPIVAARKARIPIVSEVQVALQLAPGMQVIATTGTNGKTTTTAMVGHLLRALGRDAVDIGNIGTPVSEATLREPQPEWASLEMSSFQLHDTPGFNPTVGILTTLSPDHLDRYDSVEEYYADKRLMFVNAHHNSRWVINADNALSMAMIEGVPGKVYRFSTQHTDAHAFLDRAAGALVVLGERIMQRDRLSLPGDHNVANALAAILAVMIADERHRTADARARIAEAMASFKALAHRLEPVADIDNVLWLNDSKATNVSSTLVALEGMTRPTVLLLGGRHKGEPYTGLVDAIVRSCRAVIAFGEATGEIMHDLAAPLDGKVALQEMRDATFAEVMAKARELAKPGDVVLLSPACSSYDMFNNYEERGRTFAALARGGS